MDIRDLGFFEVIGTVGHLGRAAEQLGRSQPALSKCIDRLEQDVGAPLFEHVGRGLRLTALGEVLLQQAVMIRHAMSHAMRRVREHASGSVGLVRIGAGSSMMDGILPDVIASIMQRLPGVRLTVLTGPSDSLRVMLRNREVDLVIGPLSDHDEREFTVDLLNEDAMVVAAGINHPLQRHKRVAMQELTAYRWLLPEQQLPGRRWLEARFKEAALPAPLSQVETNALLSLVGAIAQTQLLIFASRRDIQQGRGAGLLREVPVPELVMRRAVGVVHLPDRELDPAGMRALALLREVAAVFIDAHPFPPKSPPQTPVRRPRASRTRAVARASRKSTSAPIDK